MITKIRKILILILKNRGLQHTLFWLFSFVVILNIIVNNSIKQIDLLYAIIFHITLLPIVYLNILLLFPLFIKRKRFIVYLIFACVACVIFSFLNLLIFNNIIDVFFPGYYFVSIYSFIDLLKFHVVYSIASLLLKFASEWFSQEDAKFKLSKIQKEKIEIELKALRSQVNPHFLFNSLNVLYSLALKKAEETPETIIKLSDILRYVIYDSNKEKVNIKSEIELINNYLNLQKYRTDSNSEIIFDTDIRHEIQITPMLFLPLVENSFKHGIKGDILNTYVRISLFASNEELKFEIENNKGASDSPIEKTDGGVGLQNIRQRLNLLYPDNHEFVIYEDENIFKVLLKLIFRT